jgi:hypothetical protein
MKPEFAIVEERIKSGFKCFVVNTNEAKYKNIKWKDLGSFGKRKFENLLVLSNAKQRTKILYV